MASKNNEIANTPPDSHNNGEVISFGKNYAFISLKK